MGALVWKVSINGQVYDADFETLKQWVAQGSVGPTDQVYKEGLGWSEARAIPVLRDLFAPPTPPPSFGGPTYNQSPGYGQSYGGGQYPSNPYTQPSNPYGQQPSNPYTPPPSQYTPPPSQYAPPSNPYAPPSYPYAPAPDPYTGGYGGTAPAYGSVGLGLTPYAGYGVLPPTAGLGKRFIGALVDGVIGTLLTLPGWSLQKMGEPLPGARDGSPGMVLLGALIQWVAILGFALFCASMLSKDGTTPGKRVAGTVVLDDNGQFLTFWKAFGRQFLRTIFGCFCLPNLWLLFDQNRQQIYDKVVGANVYER